MGCKGNNDFFWGGVTTNLGLMAAQILGGRGTHGYLRMRIYFCISGHSLWACIVAKIFGRNEATILHRGHIGLELCMSHLK